MIKLLVETASGESFTLWCLECDFDKVVESFPDNFKIKKVDD